MGDRKEPRPVPTDQRKPDPPPAPPPPRGVQQHDEQEIATLKANVAALDRIQRENAEAAAMWAGRALKAEEALAAMREERDQLKEAAQIAASFLNTIEWNDNSSAMEAENVTNMLEDAVNSLLSRTGEPVTLPPERATAPTDWAASNCHMLARREIRRLDAWRKDGGETTPIGMAVTAWQHVIRICEKAGVRQAGVLREKPMSADARLTDSEMGKASGSATESSLRDQLAHLTEERETIRRVLNTDLKAASERVLTLELENQRLTEEREGLRAENIALRDNNQAVKALFDARGTELAALTAAHERVREALTKLRAEVAGVLSYAGVEIRGAIGNTNMTVLRQRVSEADEALTSPEGPIDNGPWDPDPTCPTCKGSGDASNAQFTCACRWRRRPTSPEGPPQETR